MEDEYYMRRAIELAKKGAGFVNPNPMVGAVIVKEGEIIGEGFHEKYGTLHAERNALKNCMVSPEGATLYVTLEPCCHYGKTPPCTEAIIESGIKKVYVGAYDINPLVAGKGVQILREHNIVVVVGLLENECKRLNKVFNKYMTTKRPYVQMKYAMTADGKIATSRGESQWITSEASRKKVHDMRNALSGIMVGINTVLSDDPVLNCRREIPSKNPVRIICDTYLRIPMDSKIVKTANEIPTIIATASDDVGKADALKNEGCKVIKIKRKSEGIDLNELMKALGEMQVDSILLEGGATLNYSAIESGIVDEIDIFMAPKIFGGRGKGPIEGNGISDISDAIKIRPVSYEKIDEDLYIENEVIY